VAGCGVDALKVAHHGSDKQPVHGAAGHTRLQALPDLHERCPPRPSQRRRHGPSPQARRPDKQIAFNYRERAARWDVENLTSRCGYTVAAPLAGADGFLTVDFMTHALSELHSWWCEFL
jgi:hypothetical protein